MGKAMCWLLLVTIVVAVFAESVYPEERTEDADSKSGKHRDLEESTTKVNVDAEHIESDATHGKTADGASTTADAEDADATHAEYADMTNRALEESIEFHEQAISEIDESVASLRESAEHHRKMADALKQRRALSELGLFAISTEKCAIVKQKQMDKIGKKCHHYTTVDKANCYINPYKGLSLFAKGIEYSSTMPCETLANCKDITEEYWNKNYSDKSCSFFRKLDGNRCVEATEKFLSTHKTAHCMSMNRN